MAGDWIPIRKELDKVREVLFVHQRSGQSIPDVIFALIKMWSWFDSEAVEGFVPGLTSEICPELFGQTSEFWLAVMDSGWLLADQKDGQIGLRIPNPDHWLGATAKTRLLDAARKRRERASGLRPKNVRKKSGKKRTTEQNRTEENNTLPKALPANAAGASRFSREERLAYARSLKNINSPEGFTATTLASGARDDQIEAFLRPPSGDAPWHPPEGQRQKLYADQFPPGSICPDRLSTRESEEEDL